VRKKLFSDSIILLVLCFFFLSPANSLAGQASLAWDPPDISTDVTGYMLYYGTVSGAYSQSIDVGNTTDYTVGNLIDGKTYYFAVTAYNAAGYQSVYSNEVSLTLSPPQYLLLTVKPGAGQGTVSGPGISCGDTCLAAYNPGTVVSLSAAASPGSTFGGWSGGGCSGTGLCTVTINANVTITADFKTTPAPTTIPTTTTTSILPTTTTTSVTTTILTTSTTSVHTTVPTTTTSIPPTTSTYVTTTSSTTSVPVRYSITALYGVGGTISPSGTSSLNYGESKTFTITPNTGYRIAIVVVDGMSVGAVNSYTFSNVAANHYIVATFTAADFTTTPAPTTIPTTTTTSVLPTTTTTSVTTTILTTSTTSVHTTIPTTTTSIPPTTSTYVTTTSSTTSVPVRYSITALYGVGGTISPSGTSSLNYGESKTFTITPNTGYRIAIVVVDGMSVGAVNSYTFSNVTANHYIVATFGMKY
jgi:hypothetical protein